MQLIAGEIKADISAIANIEAVPNILKVICRTTGMGFAAIARVTDDRWVACSVRDEIAFGLAPGSELDPQTTFCHEIRKSGIPVVIENARQDPVYAEHPVPVQYGFQSYISMPIIRRDGSFFGTLCAIDPAPARLKTPETIGMFELFVDLIAFHLEANERILASEAALADANETARQREQFIAMLGHDLRNPLASIDAGARLLLRDPPRERANAVLALMHGSVQRMASLIDNVLDLARSRLGNGIRIDRQPSDLGPVFDQVVEELRASHPASDIALMLDLDGPVLCDPARIAQLASNLLSNALTHGAPDQPVTVDATARDGRFTLCVTNKGDPIPEDARARLFEPFARGVIDPDLQAQGLGLGLYIAARIAAAHGGTLDLASTPTHTCFTLNMPTGA